MKAPVVANTKSARPVRGMPPREHFGSGANFVQQMQAVRVRQFEYKLRLASDVVRNKNLEADIIVGAKTKKEEEK